MILIRDMVEKDYEQKGYIHFKSWIETYKGASASSLMLSPLMRGRGLKLFPPNFLAVPT